MKLMNVCSVDVLSGYKVRLGFTNGVEKVRDPEISKVAEKEPNRLFDFWTLWTR